MMLAFYWDPNPIVFTLPFINRPVAWYGVLFVLGFIAAYYLMIPLLKKHYGFTQKQAVAFSDRFSAYILCGTLIGARLGYVLFYALPIYIQHPLEIFKIWHGGLASHGGILGIFTALILFQRHIHKTYPQFSFLNLLDLLAGPAIFTCGMIRLGNFMNQEIVGTSTALPWGVVFGHPSTGGELLARHPVQIYEALAYFTCFIVIYRMATKKLSQLVPGVLINTLFVLAFGSRFILEFFKAPTSQSHTEHFILTGQLLSIPFILWGSISLFYLYRKNSCSLSIQP